MNQRIHIVIQGAVQGVGFRPFMYRLADELHLNGWVLNSPQGVFVEAEGTRDVLEDFLLRLNAEKPPQASIHSLEFSFLDPVGYSSFEIKKSETAGETTAIVLPDIATCPDCLREIFEPGNRRHRYPFTNCTNCGPRFTIIEALPYDRPNTTMKRFVMCDDCRREYVDPRDRRFHAQPNACPRCGPHLELWDSEGATLASHDAALKEAIAAITTGEIVATKGIGGFHLMVDAGNEQAVRRLRERKHREEKPFAVMFPTVHDTKIACKVSALEERLLASREAPIVLLERHGRNFTQGIAPSVAPKNPYLGVILPYTPLHHILLRELGRPVVATSGNLSDEPICIDEREALDRLRGIADCFLVHDRPICRHVDDSIACVMMGRELVMRRARGYAPLPIQLMYPLPDAIAVGGHLKNTIAVSRGRNVFVSQHIGDLETEQSLSSFKHEIAAFRDLYKIRETYIVSDLHPDYLSTQYARGTGIPAIAVQHHYAHIASCMAENELEGEVLGVSWDGTGFGLDGTMWGGEFLLTDRTSFQRVASFRAFRLPGGEKAVKEPRRAAVGLLFELLGDAVFRDIDLPPLREFTPADRAVLHHMLTGGINAPVTSSAGRLFDAVSALLGLRQHCSFEGQAAMELEFAIDQTMTDARYRYRIADNGATHYTVDWAPLIEDIIDDIGHRTSTGIVSTRFHNTLAEIIADVAQRINRQRVVLSGGCFQNRYLTERAVRRLESAGFHPYWHQRVPPNDGGISLGQLYALARKLHIPQQSQEG